MSLGAPWGLLALLLWAPLLAIYLLRRRHPPRLVSALFLWRPGPQEHRGGRHLDKLSREVSLLCEALAVLFGALVLANARCDGHAGRGHVVVVLDGGMSMLARGKDGATSHERARREASALTRKHSTITLIESGSRPRILAGPAASRDDALAALSSWRPQGPSHDPTAALALARRHARAGGAIFFFTDALPKTSPGVTVHALGEPVDNIALVSAHRFVEAGMVQVRVGVANFSRAAARLEVTFSAGQRLTEEVALAPGASEIVRAKFEGDKPVQISLPDDALPADNVVTLHDSRESPQSVAVLEGLAPEAEAALTRFLRVAPAVRLDAGGRPLSFGSRASPASVTLGASGQLSTLVGPFLADGDNPLLDDVRFSGVVWVVGDNPPGQALLRVGPHALMTEDEAGRIHLNLDLAQSNLQRTAAWPVLLGNLLRRWRAQAPGFSARHVPLGGAADVVTDGRRPFRLRMPEGERPLAQVGALHLTGLSPPGEYELWLDHARINTLHVLPIDPGESDLRDRGSGELKAAAPAVLAHSSASDSGWLSLAALLAVLADFVLSGVRRVPRNHLSGVRP